jgi:hypothetical protein
VFNIRNLFLTSIAVVALPSSQIVTAANYAELGDPEELVAPGANPGFVSRNKHYIMAGLVALTAAAAANPDLVAKTITDILVATGLNKTICTQMTQEQLRNLSAAFAQTYLVRGGVNYFNPCSGPWSISHILEVYGLIPDKPHCKLIPTLFAHLAQNGFVPR